MTWKDLLILRHAKAEEKQGSQPDKYRSLLDKGRSDADHLAKELSDKKLIPDFLLVSEADRAQQTKNQLVLNWQHSIKCLVDPNLYLATWIQYDERIQRVDPAVQCLMVIGHNPDLIMLVQEYTNSFIDLPTCGLVHIRFQVETWNELLPSSGTIHKLWSPKRSWFDYSPFEI
jgi:phosphohistidine phosphatase